MRKVGVKVRTLGHPPAAGGEKILNFGAHFHRKMLNGSVQRVVLDHAKSINQPSYRPPYRGIGLWPTDLKPALRLAILVGLVVS